MKQHARRLAGSSKWPLLAIFALLACALVFAACGGSGGTTTTTAGSTTAETSVEVAAGGSNEAWSLPNANVQNTRAIKSDITPSNVTTLKPAWAVTVTGTGKYGSFAGGEVFSPDGKTVYLQDLSNDVFAVDDEAPLDLEACRRLAGGRRAIELADQPLECVHDIEALPRRLGAQGGHPTAIFAVVDCAVVEIGFRHRDLAGAD